MESYISKKVKVDSKNRMETDGRTGGVDCITSRANAVGKNYDSAVLIGDMSP